MENEITANVQTEVSSKGNLRSEERRVGKEFRL